MEEKKLIYIYIYTHELKYKHTRIHLSHKLSADDDYLISHVESGLLGRGVIFSLAEKKT